VNRTEAAPPGRGGGGRCLPFVRMPQRHPSRGTSETHARAGRPVMGQLSPKKVLDDARPTESTNLERQAVGTVGTPRGGDHPGCRGGRRGSGQPPPARTVPRHRWATRPDEGVGLLP